MPSLVVSRHHGRLSYAICYAVNPRPTLTLGKVLVRIPIKPDAAAGGLGALERQFTVPVLRGLYPGVDFGDPEIAAPAAAAAQPATTSPSLALPLEPGPVALSGLPVGSGGGSREDDSWMWNLGGDRAP